MRLQLLAAAAALLVAPPALAADRTYDLPTFTGIHVASGIDAVVTVGPAQSVSATAPDAADLDDLQIEVQDGTLKIWRDWNVFDLLGDIGERRTRFTITAPALNSADVSAGADLDISGLSGESVWLEASSGADLDATDIQATKIEVDVSSGADVTANGTCTELEVDASSGAHANLRDLHCTDGEVEASSGSEADISLSGTLRAEASSGASISVKGKPTVTGIKESSGGKVTLAD